MFEAHVLGCTGPFKGTFANILWFRGLFRVLGSGFGFHQFDFGATRDHFRVSRSVSRHGLKCGVSPFRFRAQLESVLRFLGLFRVLLERV